MQCFVCEATISKKANFCWFCGNRTSRNPLPPDPREDNPEWQYQLKGKAYPDTPDFGFLRFYDFFEGQYLPVYLAIRFVPLGLLIQTPDGVACRSEDEADAFQQKLLAHRRQSGEKFPVEMQQKLPLLDSKGRKILH